MTNGRYIYYNICMLEKRQKIKKEEKSYNNVIILIESATGWRPDRGCQNRAIVVAIAQRS